MRQGRKLLNPLTPDLGVELRPYQRDICAQVEPERRNDGRAGSKGR